MGGYTVGLALASAASGKDLGSRVVFRICILPVDLAGASGCLCAYACVRASASTGGWGGGSPLVVHRRGQDRMRNLKLPLATVTLLSVLEPALLRPALLSCCCCCCCCYKQL